MEALRPGDPDRIGRYVLLARLGAGGMGQVFLGRSPAGLPVALKVVHANLAADQRFRARFRREVTAAKAVSGAFTAPVIDADPDGPLPWLATSFLPGMSLQDAVTAHGPLPPPTVYALGAGLAEALASVHRAGVVHRDLKPSNVMLSPDGPRVIDFGIAHAADIGAITQVGHAIGSPGFMSPEQAQGHQTGPASDVFSFGTVLTYAATGDGPFGDVAAHVLIYRVVHEAPNLEKIGDPGLREIVAACLDKRPDQRPPVDALLRWFAPRAPQTGVLQGTSWLPDPVAADVARRTAGGTGGPGVSRRRLLAVGGSGAAVLAAGGGVAAAVMGARSGSGGSAAASAGSGSPAAGRPVAPSAAPVPTREGRVRWKHDTGGYLISDPTVAAGTVYVGGAKGLLLALDAGTGRLRWRHRVAAPDVDVSAAPAYAGGVVFAGGGDGGLYALDARTGRLKWRYTAGTQLPCAPVVDRGTVYVASQMGNVITGFKGGYLTALDAASGAVRWRRRTKEAIGSEFTVSGGVIYLPDEALQALDAATGRVRWTYEMRTPKSVTLANGLVYCGNFQGEELHVVEAATGRRRWTYRTGGATTARPLVANGAVLIGDWDGAMFALDAVTGSMRWQLQTGGSIESSAAMAGGLVCFGSGAFSNGNVYAVEPATGRPVWRYEAPEGITSSPAAAPDGTAYLSCKDGVIYALDSKGGTGTVPPTAE